MRITELVERSGVPAETIKYYVRDGLLPAGERRSAKHTEYSEGHLNRLRLVRAMLEVGNLSTASILEILAALDAPELDIVYAFEIAQRSLARAAVTATSEPSVRAMGRVDALVERAGWSDCSNNVGRGIVARVLDAAEASGLDLDDDYLDEYAAAATVIAAADVAALRELPDRSTRAHVMIVGTVLGDPLSAGLRRIAQEHLSNQPNA